MSDFITDIFTWLLAFIAAAIVLLLIFITVNAIMPDYPGVPDTGSVTLIANREYASVWKVEDDDVTCYIWQNGSLGDMECFPQER